MKVGETKPVTGPAPVRERAPQDGVAATERANAAPRDRATIMGVPVEELSPKARDVLMTLMAEVDQLKRELENNRRRVLELEAMADQDALLPMLNRRAFERELARVHSYAKRYSVPVSLLYLDLNRFKEINDRHGHAAGDAVLQHVAALLLGNVRESDVVGRIGGDEFGVALMQSDTQSAGNKAEALLAAIARDSVAFEDHELQVSAAAGVASLNDADDAQTALASADAAMYAQKADDGEA